VTENVLAEWARLWFGTLLAAGIRDVVVSPGSRSTPFIYAALTTPGLRCHSVWDERAAGFFALGQARLSGRPSALLATSGSAVANYFPAVVEAAYAHLPLLVLSADRPFELQDVGAAQSMDQVKLFGGMARRYFDLGHPDGSAVALDAVQRLALRAVEHALAPDPGPVHVNLRARKPLEPRTASSAGERALTAAVSERLERPARLVSAERAPASAATHELTRALARRERGLIVVGPLSPSADLAVLLELGKQLDFPVCAEAASQLRFSLPSAAEAVVGGLDALIDVRGLQPDCVLQFGATPTSGAYERFTRESSAERAVIAAHGFPDPSSRAGFAIEAEPAAFARALLTATAGSAVPSAQRRFAEAWRRADSTYFQLATELCSHAELDEPSAVRAALAGLPEHGVLGLGNSLPIRDVDAFVPPRRGRVRVWSQRGLNGIDGLVSGAIGAAQQSAAPNLTLLGDVSFFHDLGALSLAKQLESPLSLVVIDNGGGRIFEHLPLSALLAERPDLAAFWTTPHGFDLRHAAALFELPFEAPRTAAELTLAVQNSLERPGCTLIQVRVPADSARAALVRLRKRLELELS
jgi:2-succinyl-5-enolpyruvyl-6-hydroxy-3-cyclohexene-1-carboxylate synthase